MTRNVTHFFLFYFEIGGTYRFPIFPFLICRITTVLSSEYLRITHKENLSLLVLFVSLIYTNIGVNIPCLLIHGGVTHSWRCYTHSCRYLLIHEGCVMICAYSLTLVASLSIKNLGIEGKHSLISFFRYS